MGKCVLIFPEPFEVLKKVHCILFSAGSHY
jgi:hypothetical protein